MIIVYYDLIAFYFYVCAMHGFFIFSHIHIIVNVDTFFLGEIIMNIACFKPFFLFLKFKTMNSSRGMKGKKKKSNRRRENKT